MAEFFAIELQGEQELIARLQKISDALDDTLPLFTAIGAQLETNINLRFDTKVDPDGLPWAPLAESTKKSYASKDRDEDGTVTRRGTLLERSGLMRSSLTSNPSTNEIEVGFGRPYAIFHEFGTVKMPRRGLLTSDPEGGVLGVQDRDDILQIAAGFLGDALA